LCWFSKFRLAENQHGLSPKNCRTADKPSRTTGKPIRATDELSQADQTSRRLKSTMLQLSNEYSRIVVLRKIAKFPRQMLYNTEIIATEALSGKHADESNR